MSRKSIKGEVQRRPIYECRCDERLKTKIEGSASLSEEKIEQMLTGFKKTSFHDGQLVKNLKGKGKETMVQNGCLTSLSEEKKEQLLTGFEVAAWHGRQLTKLVRRPR